MPHKQVLFRSAAREKILRGATQLCDAVRVTLGPKSKSVLIQKNWGSPIVCNDGVTIAKGPSISRESDQCGLHDRRLQRLCECRDTFAIAAGFHLADGDGANGPRRLAGYA